MAVAPSSEAEWTPRAERQSAAPVGANTCRQGTGWVLSRDTCEPERGNPSGTRTHASSPPRVFPHAPAPSVCGCAARLCVKAKRTAKGSNVCDVASGGIDPDGVRCLGDSSRHFNREDLLLPFAAFQISALARSQVSPKNDFGLGKASQPLGRGLEGWAASNASQDEWGPSLQGRHDHWRPWNECRPPSAPRP